MGTPAAAPPLPQEPWRAIPLGRVDERSGAVRSLFGLSFEPTTASPEESAREYLRAAAPFLGLRADLADLETVRTRTGLGTRHVLFRQTVGGIPVYDSETVVSLREETGTVVAVASGYVPGASLPSGGPALGPSAAGDAALRAVTRAGRAEIGPFAELQLLARGGSSRLVHRVTFVTPDPLGDWEVLVDAATGEALSVRNRMRFAHGTGLVFNPDPITTDEVPYGTPGYADSADGNTPELEAARRCVPLYDLTKVGNKFRLDGPYVKIQDFPTASGAPLGDNPVAYEQTDPDSFLYTRSEKGFEAVSVYAHMAILQEWIQLLGFTDVNNDQDSADPHGLGNHVPPADDNSFYSPTADAFAFGDGGVDDAEDAGVIAHEYGHAIQEDQVTDWGRFLEGGAMGEGFGDYLAGSHVGWLGDFQVDTVFKWGAIGDPPYSDNRRWLNSTKTYPDSLEWEVHADGEIWAACLWEIHGALGRYATDALVLQSHFYLTPGATFRDGALALLQADLDLNAGANQVFIRQVFESRGILRDAPFPIAAASGHQTVPRVSYDRKGTGDWGRYTLSVWQDTRNGPPGESYGRGVHASGGLADPEFLLPSLLEPDVAFAPLQFGNPDFLVVGTLPVGLESDIAGVLVADSAFSTGASFPLASTPDPESAPAIDAVNGVYLAVYQVDPGGAGSPHIEALLLDGFGTPLAGPSAIVSGSSQWDPAVGAGRDTATGAGRFLVVWSERDLIPEAHDHIRAVRFDEAGTQLDIAPIDIALAPVPNPPFVAPEFNMTPAVAFDGWKYLVVWYKTIPMNGIDETWGCFVDPTSGAAGAPFLIDAGPGVVRYPDVAFASTQYLVVWERSAVGPSLNDILGKRLDTGGSPFDLDPLVIAASDSVERSPAVTEVGGDSSASAGQRFQVVWAVRPPDVSDYDVHATFVPEVPSGVPHPNPLALDVAVLAPPDTLVAPGDTVHLFFLVANAGSRKDHYTIFALGSAPWPITWTDDCLPVESGDDTLIVVSVFVPGGAAPGDADTLSLYAVSTTDPSIGFTTAGPVLSIDAGTGASSGPPLAFRLRANEPNPFNPQTTIRYEIPQAGTVLLAVYDVRGRLVRRLVDEESAPPGRYEAAWNGDDEAGRPAGSGTYFCRLTAGPRSGTGKMTLVR